MCAWNHYLSSWACGLKDFSSKQFHSGTLHAVTINGLNSLGRTKSGSLGTTSAADLESFQVLPSPDGIQGHKILAFSPRTYG